MKTKLPTSVINLLSLLLLFTIMY